VTEYVDFVDRWTDEQKWEFLKSPAPGDDSCELFMWLFNWTGTIKKNMQEYIIQKKPHLISEIKNLDPELAKKYSHEVELGKVDL
jgi:hypothetical protein